MSQVKPNISNTGGIAVPKPAVDNTIIALEVEGNNPRDKVTEEIKVTAGYFTGAIGKISGSSQISTASIDDANEHYYFDIALGNATSTPTQLSVAYGNISGAGSVSGSGIGVPLTNASAYGQTAAIYKYWAEMLLPENEVTGGFHIMDQGTFAPSKLPVAGTPRSHQETNGADKDIYVVLAERTLMKDRINPKNWTFVFSGSNSAATAGADLYLTDDSDSIAAVHTIMGDRYNIVSGALGTAVSSSAERCFGFFYPDVGAWVFSAGELSASIPGNKLGQVQVGNQVDGTVAYASGSHQGFGVQGSGSVNENNALRLINCLHGSSSTGQLETLAGGSLQIRSEEIQQSVSYFCRINPNLMNFSNNPTFLSGH